MTGYRQRTVEMVHALCDAVIDRIDDADKLIDRLVEEEGLSGEAERALRDALYQIEKVLDD